MRLPWEQLAMEVIEVSAPELGDKLYPDLEPELAEAAAGWGIVHLVKWALARCPEHLPPSASALVPGPTAARQIARAARYRGRPEVFCAAATTLPNPVIEVVPEGIRLRGLDRYDAAWGDRHPKEWEAWKAAHPEKYPAGGPPGPRRKSAGNRSGSRPPDPDPDPDADRDKDAPPPPRPKLVVVGKTLRVKDLTPDQRTKWDRVQLGRVHKGLLRETDPPAAFPDWCAGVDVRRLVEAQWVHALTLYLSDEHFSGRKWPTAVFITPGVWLQRLPRPPEEVML